MSHLNVWIIQKKNQDILIHYPFEINKLFQLLKQEFTFFKSLLLNLPVFQLNNRFVFHRTSAVNLQSILKFLQPIYNVLASDNTCRSSVYIFPAVSLSSELHDRIVRAFQLSSAEVEWRWVSIPVQPWSWWALISSTQIRLYVQ